MPSPLSWDAALRARVGRLPTTRADRWLRRLSTSADRGVLWLGLAALLGLRPGRLRRSAVRGVGSQLVSSALVNLVLKRLFGRVRPDLADVATSRALPRAPRSSSFPSGHAASAAAFATGAALESPALGALLTPVALGIGYSRVHVGVHHPSDVVAGLAVGSTLALASQHWWRVRPTGSPGVRGGGSVQPSSNLRFWVWSLRVSRNAGGYGPPAACRRRTSARSTRRNS